MDVRLPNLGEGVDSGSVVGLLVKEGDQIKKGQTILELENEKAVAPIPSPADGRVASIRVKAGDKISVGQVILSIAEDEVEKDPPAKKEAAPAATGEPNGVAKADEEPKEPEVTEGTPAVQEPKSGIAPAASPSIRKIARELGIDLNRVRGSERGGRIVIGDLKAYIESLQQSAFAQKPAKAAKAPAEAMDFSKWGLVNKRPLTSLRQTIGRHLLDAWTSIPHVTQFDEADITALMDLRQKFKAAYEAKGAHLTLTCFALKAVVAVLKKHPIFNSSLDEANQTIVLKEYFHIGLAVDTEAGLIVPVIRDVDKKDLVTLAKELSALAEKARERKISLDELKGGSFTISNQGGIGGAHFTPIVNKPEVAILGLGRGVTKAAVKNNKVEPRLMLPLCLSYDHRLIDGGQAARFIHDLVEVFENFPEQDVKL